jgi:hypothetical protein
MNEKHGSNGFFVGLLVGAAVGALVSTKKGRQILKDLSDYGLEYVGNVVNLEDFEGILDDEEVMSEEMGKELTPEVVETEEKPKKKRLFRGLRKKN